MKRIKRALWFIAALIFLFEAWLWDHLYPVVAHLIAWLPWKHVKSWAAKTLERLPPVACLLIFIFPVLIILPLKILGVWLMGTQHVLLGLGVFILAKLAGLGVTAFIFETCKPKLLSLRWMLRLYELILAVKGWALRQTEPARRQIHEYKGMLLGKRSRMLALLKKIRSSVFSRVRKAL